MAGHLQKLGKLNEALLVPLLASTTLEELEDLWSDRGLG